MYQRLGIIIGCVLIGFLSTQLRSNHDLNDYSFNNDRCVSAIKKYKQRYEPSCFCYPRKPTAFAYNIGRDVVSLFAHIWNWDTYKILVGFFPVFIGARMIDERIQNKFFCHGCHSNVNQLPGWCHEAVRFGLGVPIAVLGSMALFARDFELRYTSWMLLLGMPFVIFGKDIIKNLDARFCLRPWHEDFCTEKHTRSSGGFPSGHMAQAVYIAALFGSRYGPRAAIPLGLYAAAMGIVFINCNRHYLSQMVAGAALGTIFAYAANKVIDHRLNEQLSVNVGCNSMGCPAFGASWKF
jgi:membrane-associated phospholipid phosphatase